MGIEVAAANEKIWVTIHGKEESLRIGLEAEHAVDLINAIEQALDALVRPRVCSDGVIEAGREVA